MATCYLDENELAILWLHSFSLGVKKREAVLALFEEPKQMLGCFEGKKEFLVSLLGDKTYAKMVKTSPKTEAKKLFDAVNKLKIGIITMWSKDYPKALREIADPPLVLFALGNVDLLKEKSIAVVGTRKPTAYGKEVCKSFCERLADAGVVLVSGLAYGIDSIAHVAAVEEGHSKTIAVMGGGLDDIYPSAHTQLARQIVKTGGLLVSEYFPGVRPTSYTFPERNRIVSALSCGVLVIEAGENSGSLHTVGFAVEQGKELFIVPANITSSASFGSNRVLVEMPHALVTSADQILERLGIETLAPKEEFELDAEEKMVYDLVSREPIEFDELAEKCHISTEKLSSLLTIMEMNGIIRRLPGNYVAAGSVR